MSNDDNHYGYLIKNDDPHDLALNDDDAALIVDAYATRMLKNVCSKFTDELAVLVVDLDLVEVKKIFEDYEE